MAGIPGGRGVAFDDLDVDAQADVVLDDLVLEALVDQGIADGVAGVFGGLVQQNDARGVVMDVRGEDDDRDDQADATASPRLRPGTRLAGLWQAVEAGTPAAVDAPGVQDHQSRVL